jgi:hypothetical protein
MISINWPQVIQWLLMLFGGVGTAGLVVQWAQTQKAARQPGNPVSPDPTKPTEDPANPDTWPIRAADAPPPVGAQEWAQDICSAMGSAGADSKLASILAGETRDKARARRIAELEDHASEPVAT